MNNNQLLADYIRIFELLEELLANPVVREARGVPEVLGPAMPDAVMVPALRSSEHFPMSAHMHESATQLHSRRDATRRDTTRQHATRRDTSRSQSRDVRRLSRDFLF